MDFIACSLRNFDISNYSGPIKIKNNDKPVFFLLYEDEDLFNIPMSYNYATRFGADEIARLLNSVVCFGRYNTSIDNINKRIIMVNNFYANCQMFSNALWFVKDNSVTPYFATLSSDCEIEPEYLRRNIYYSDSETKYDTNISFTIAEINEAMKWYQELYNLADKKKSEEINIDDSADLVNMSSFISFEIPSFQRALYFLDTARRTDFLPAKIANYISILECLFAVSGENTHKTAERAATFIGGNGEERIKVFKDVVKTYDIRSKYVHGSEIKSSTHNTLPSTSKIIDNIVRKVLIKIITEHPELNYRNKAVPGSKKREEVNEWFNHLPLSKE